MTQNLKYKALFILAVTLACVYGIIGLPTSVEQLKENFQNRIRLGLDLKGGSQLVMQIQVQDAFKTEADTVIQRLRADLGTRGIPFTDITRTDPQTIDEGPKIAINIMGLPQTRAGDLRQLINESYGVWTLNSAGNDFRLTMKPTDALAMVRDTRTQTMNTIEKKINGLGLSEATVQQRGGTSNESELLVQLPGVDDPARIQQLLKTSAKLELFEAQGGPFSSREEALNSKPGGLGYSSQIKGSGQGGFFILARTPVVTGRDVRNSQPQKNSTTGTWETTFVLSQDAAKRFGDFTANHIGKQLAIVLDDQVLMAPTVEAVGSSRVDLQACKLEYSIVSPK